MSNEAHDRPDPSDWAEAALRGLADDQWARVMNDEQMPLAARLRALHRQLKTLGFDAEAELVVEVRAAMAYAGARIDEITALVSRPALAGDVERAVLVGFVRKAAHDSKGTLQYGIRDVEEAG